MIGALKHFLFLKAVWINGEKRVLGMKSPRVALGKGGFPRCHGATRRAPCSRPSWGLQGCSDGKFPSQHLAGSGLRLEPR